MEKIMKKYLKITRPSMGNAVFISDIAYTGIVVYRNGKGGAMIGMGEIPSG